MNVPTIGNRKQEIQDDEPPPFLRTWPRVYIGVLSYTFALIATLYVISRLLAP